MSSFTSKAFDPFAQPDAASVLKTLLSCHPCGEELAVEGVRAVLTHPRLSERLDRASCQALENWLWAQTRD